MLNHHRLRSGAFVMIRGWQADSVSWDGRCAAWVRKSGFFMEQAPQWLPYRLRMAVDQWRINRALRGLDLVQPVSADGPAGANAEVFMLLCRRDLRLGALAMKSLLHQRGEVKLAATVIDDGSLSAADRAWFDRQIPNVRWQISRDPQILSHPQMIKKSEACKLYLEPTFPHMPKLVHPMLTSRSERVVVMDSDTCFFQPPVALLDYCLGRTQAPRYMHDHQDESKAVPPEVPEIFASLVNSLPLREKRFRLKHWFFNAGLLAYRPADFDFDVTERYLRWLAQAPPAICEGKQAIWFGSWTREQTMYLLMFASGPIEAEPLGDDYWLGGAPGHVFNHFLRHYLVRKSCLDMLRGMIKRLQNG